MSAVCGLHVGERVRLLRDLSSLRSKTEGTVRGMSASAKGISYAVLFDNSMRIVAERDLTTSPRSS